MPHLNVQVTPKAKQNKVIKLSQTSYKVWTTAAPESGKANKAVIKLLADFLKVKKSSLNLIAGLKAKEKIFLLESQDLE